MKKYQKYLIIPVMAVAFLLFSTQITAGAAADEASTASVTLSAVTLASHSSYVSDSYFGVINLSVEDPGVVTVTTDSQGHVVMSAISSGVTKVHYWYRADGLSGWTRATVPVTVSGAAVSAEAADAQTGLVFPQNSISIQNGSDYTVTGITLNGKSVGADTLLWVSSTSSVASVESATGKITAVGLGTAVIYAIDPVTKNVANINLSVY